MSVAPPCVVVTRPQPQADEWVSQLRALGLNAGPLPLLGIAAPADGDLVRAAWRQLAQHALVVFVSPSAVERFFALRPAGSDWPPRAIAAGTGPGTRRALLQAGVPEPAVLTPPETMGQFDSEALWVLLRERLSWPGHSALIVRGDGGRDWLADALRRECARVHFVQAYRRTAPVLDPSGRALLSQALTDPARHCWLFSSREALGHLQSLVPDRCWRDDRALATHSRIVEAARELGFGHVQQVAPTPEAVAEVLRGI